MTKEQLIAELEELETRLRKLAERTTAKMEAEAAGERALLYAGQANGYEMSADMLANTLHLAKTEW